VLRRIQRLLDIGCDRRKAHRLAQGAL
jgi:hypothetical protein